MGYYACSKETNVRITASEAARLVKEYNEKHNDLPDVAHDICDIFEDTGFYLEPIMCYDREPRRCENSGDFSFYFEYNPWHSDEAEEFLNMIAPFVDRGSYITFIGEDDFMWAYYFDGKKATMYGGEVCFPGMPGEIAYRGLSEHESAMTNIETIFGKELAHNLPQDFVDRINAAKPGTILQSIAEALFDAITCRPVRVNPIPTSALGQALGNVLVDEFVGGGAA